MSGNLDTGTWLFVRKLFALHGFTLVELNIQLRETEIQESLGHGLRPVKCFNKFAVNMVLNFSGALIDDILQAQTRCLEIIKTVFVYIELKNICTTKPKQSENTTITIDFDINGSFLQKFEEMVRNTQ